MLVQNEKNQFSGSRGSLNGSFLCSYIIKMIHWEGHEKSTSYLHFVIKASSLLRTLHLFSYVLYSLYLLQILDHGCGHRLAVLHLKPLKDLNDILKLPKENLPWFLPTLQTQEVMHHANVFHLKLSCHVFFASCNELLSTRNKPLLIYIQHQNEHISPNKYELQVRICFTFCEAHTLSANIHLSLNNTMLYLQTIDADEDES